jgi:hypothetical protein
MADDNRYPCPGTPAVADILQCLGAFAIYAIDSLLFLRVRNWNYRSVCPSEIEDYVVHMQHHIDQLLLRDPVTKYPR